jgi:hypothetical protein
MTSMTPDWTPATSRGRVAAAPDAYQGGADGRDFSEASGWLAVAGWFRNARGALQKRSIAKSSTLLMVCRLISRTMGGVAYSLLKWPNVDGY